MSPRRRFPVLQRPEQGWASLLLLLALLVLLGLSIGDARPLRLIDEGDSASGRLWLLMLAAGLIGFLLARSSLGVVRAHLVGATVAAFSLLMVAGAQLVGSASPLPLSQVELGERVAAVWQRLDADVATYVSDRAAMPTTATFLVLGAICWTTAQFSAFSVFRYGRGGPAVMAIGAVLFLNLGFASLDPEAAGLPVVPLLALFSALSMLLFMRLQLVGQRQRWVRRHIADTADVSRLFLRSGVAFVALTVVGASTLTTWATIDAQDVDLGDLEAPMSQLGEELSRLLSIVGVPPSEPSNVFPADEGWRVQEEWEPLSGTAFRARVEDALRGNYWWGWADDEFDGQGWDRQRLETLTLPAGEPLPPGPSAGGGYPLRATITIEGRGPVRSMAFRPPEAITFSLDARAVVVDEEGGIGDVGYDDPLRPGESVVVDAWVRDYRPGAGDLTAADLREAGDAYAPWLDRYLQGADVQTTGELVWREAERILARHDNAYDQALEAQARLQGMTYETNMGGVCAANEPVPECVLREQQGFCQHYATTMTMLLRVMGIPARIVTGYLPGDRDGDSWVVEQAAFHNWVEAYFPDYGWIRFDPTPRGEFGQEPTALPPGDDERDPTPSEGPSSPPEDPESPPPAETSEPVPGAAGTSAPPTDWSGPFLVFALVTIALGVFAVGLLLRFRRLSGSDGGAAYRGIVSLATRLGYGPHPSQTEYEYAASLGRTIPSVQEDLYLVAGARVESAYGGRRLDPSRRGSLRRAYSRVRTALLRLWLRIRR